MSLPGLSRPLRGSGIALLAVAVVAAVIGGIVLATGDENGAGTRRAAGSPSSDVPTSSSGTSRQSGETSASTNGRSATPTSREAGGTGSDTDDKSDADGKPGADDSDGDADTDADDGSGGQSDGRNGRADHEQVPVRVYNNRLVEELASQGAEDLRDQGWDVAKVSNYPGGVIPSTTAYYRKGTPEKAAALSVASTFGIRAKPRFDGIDDAAPGLIVIVTKDYESPETTSG